MIINIPLTIPDELLANTIAKDYEIKITEKLTDEVRKVLIDQARWSSYSKNEHAGMEQIVFAKVDDILKDYKDEIIEAASDKLAERLARTKKAKELLGERR